MHSRIQLYGVLALLFLVCGYSLMWINMGYETKRSLKMLISDAERRLGYRIMYSDIRIGGFPYAFTFDVSNLRVQGVHDPLRHGNYEVSLGDFTLKSNLLLQKFHLALDRDIFYSVMVEDDGKQYLFRTKINYRPSLKVGLAHSIFLSSFTSDIIKRFAFIMDSIEYEDSGYEALDDDGHTIYAARGSNSASIGVTRHKNKRTGEISKDMRFLVDIDIKPEYMDASVLPGKEYPPIMSGHKFALAVDGDIRLPSGFHSQSRDNVYMHLRRLSYTDHNFSVECEGSGGLMPVAGVVGEFRFLISNYNSFFENVVRDLFGNQKDYEEFRAKILNIADSVRASDLYLVYRADDIVNARLGSMSLADFAAFTMDKMGITEADIREGTRQAMMMLSSNGRY